jgi:tRNA dimethylallyltransferase
MASSDLKPLLAIVGPTASGKTDVALRLAKERHGEIISVDSRQIYQKLRIGTAKPAGVWKHDQYWVDGVPYHLVDIWDPAKAFTAADFIRLAEKKIQDVRERKREPILVGGTGLYFKALLDGLASLPPRNEKLRSEMLLYAEQKGRAELHARLSEVDPVAAREIPANNIQRVLRALEVFQLTGKPISQWHSEHRDQRAKEGHRIVIQMVGIDRSLKELEQRIAGRCQAMLREGLVEETETLLKDGYSDSCPGLSGLGYPRVVKFLSRELSKDEMLELIIRDTRQYAKRQLTWFRGQHQVRWTKTDSDVAAIGQSVSEV